MIVQCFAPSAEIQANIFIRVNQGSRVRRPAEATVGGGMMKTWFNLNHTAALFNRCPQTVSAQDTTN
jgi:hypothetical protein